MLRNYLKIAYRNLARNKGYSFINIGGLAVGMAVAMLIGLWVYDEMSFNKSFANYDRIAQVMMYQTFSDRRGPQQELPLALGGELRNSYSDFEEVFTSTWPQTHLIANGEKKFSQMGTYTNPQFTSVFSLPMGQGIQDGLRDVYSIMLSASAAQALFGTEDPVGKIVEMDNASNLTVTGVYEDFPDNSAFKGLEFLAPMSLFRAENDWVKGAETVWDNNMWPFYVLLDEKADLGAASAKIKDIILDKRGAEAKGFDPELTLSPMRDWHLHSPIDEARSGGGRIQFVWLFGLIGFFVLLLACINFMNLSTARSEKRAREVGIRKAVGSRRGQLAAQFLSESFLVVCVAFVIALLLVAMSFSSFNELAAKQMILPWPSPLFWGICGLFVAVTALLAGSYPALYLSSFQPVKVLKGTFRVGRYAAIPRKVLVVVQFTVSVALIIGTVVVYRQIQFAKDRPIGYDRSGLIYTGINAPELRGDYNPLRNDLLATGAVENMAESLSPITDVWANSADFEWEGKEPDYKPLIGRMPVTHDFGQTVGFQITAGRDFSRDFSTDSSAMILNESAVKVMGLKNPVGTFVTQAGRTYQVVGVIKDMVMQSPYEPINPTAFMMRYDQVMNITMRLNPAMSPAEALPKVASVFKAHSPNAPFDYKFVDEEYAAKFAAEERIGNLAGVFTGLAILISCLGLFGLASYVAEQRTKEIGVRKVLGASVVSLWRLLSKDFVLLVVIALLIATPLAWYFMDGWLQKYTYRAELSWWIFAVSGAGALLITLLTVSYQSVKAALMNPVKSLRSE